MEDQQCSFGLDLTQQIAELRRRLAEGELSPQSASGVVTTSGGAPAGAGSIAGDGHILGDFYYAYQEKIPLCGERMPSKQERRATRVAACLGCPFSG